MVTKTETAKSVIAKLLAERNAKRIALAALFALWASVALLVGCMAGQSGPHSISSYILSSEVSLPGHGASVPAAGGAGLEVRFVDVGQGDCAIISCDGHYALIDGGPTAASSKVYTVLRNLGIESLDFALATHSDADHIGGIPGALRQAPCAVCYCPVTEDDTETFGHLKHYMEGRGGALVVPQVPTVLSLGAAQLSIIGPVRAFDDDNNSSLICRVDYGTTSFLFMGDAGIEAEQALIASGAKLHADVLKVGHHGSAHSTSDAFLQAVSPHAVVISVGAGNDYGHPSARVLNALQEQGVVVYRTDTMGDVVAVSDGQQVLFSMGRWRASGQGQDSATSSESKASTAASSDEPVVDGADEGGAAEYIHADMKQFMDELPDGTRYIVNTSSMKYHELGCASVRSMAAGNALAVESRERAEQMGCTPCGNCRP